MSCRGWFRSGYTVGERSASFCVCVLESVNAGVQSVCGVVHVSPTTYFLQQSTSPILLTCLTRKYLKSYFQSSPTPTSTHINMQYIQRTRPCIDKIEGARLSRKTDEKEKKKENGCDVRIADDIRRTCFVVLWSYMKTIVSYILNSRRKSTDRRTAGKDNREEQCINDKDNESVVAAITKVTGIPEIAIRNVVPHGYTRVSEKMRWTSQCSTSRIEDMAYSLLGLFDAAMPIAYGEGARGHPCSI